MVAIAPADRCSPDSSAISPKKSPGPRWASTTFSVSTSDTILTCPRTMMNMSWSESPSRKMMASRATSTRSRLAAIDASSSGEQRAKIGTEARVLESPVAGTVIAAPP